jgi:hypothetical protein
MSSYKKILHHVNNKDFKKVHQLRCDEQKSFYFEEKKNKIVEQKKLEEIKNLSASFKSNWRKEMYPELPPQEPVKVVEERRVKVPDHLKYDWRKEINEGMTSSGVFFTNLPATGDVDLNSFSGGDESIYYSLGQTANPEPVYGYLPNTRITTNGTGTGLNGGFNIGSDYLAFDGKYNMGYRTAILNPIDTSTVDTISLSVIRGNDSNGGITPTSNLVLLYYNIDTDDGGGITVSTPSGFTTLTKQVFNLPPGARGKNVEFYLYDSPFNPQSFLSGYHFVGKSYPQGLGVLSTYSVHSSDASILDTFVNLPYDQIPNYSGGIQWSWYAIGSYFWHNIFFPAGGSYYNTSTDGPPAPISGNTRRWTGTVYVDTPPPPGYMTLADYVYIGQTIYNHFKNSATYGVSNISFQRRTPISVLVPLDSPEAVSFIRVGSDVKTGTPGERYRKVMEQLKASKDYTTTKFGSNFPGSNFSGISDVEASPIGKEASYDTWNKSAEKNAQQAASTFNQSQQSTQGFDISKMEKDYGKVSGLYGAEISALVDIVLKSPEGPTRDGAYKTLQQNL